jgi:hypothetical protein
MYMCDSRCWSFPNKLHPQQAPGEAAGAHTMIRLACICMTVGAGPFPTNYTLSKHLVSSQASKLLTPLNWSCLHGYVYRGQQLLRCIMLASGLTACAVSRVGEAGEAKRCELSTPQGNNA